MPSAIVTGATGIFGWELVQKLSRNRGTWEKIYATSRSKIEDWGSDISHSHLDLCGSAQAIAKELRGIDFEYPTEELATKVNGEMLTNFLEALVINGTVSNIKRFVLVTGAKQYGVHLGQVNIPMSEEDLWLPEPPFPPNFYYHQQRILKDFGTKYSLDWTVTYPNEALGFAKGNFMNVGSGVAIYAAICKELGNELPFPGSEIFYTLRTSFSDARLHAEFCHWAVFEPKAANQAFNVVNGGVPSWQDLWPKVAEFFGLTVPADQFTRPAPLAAEIPLASKPPISVFKETGLENKPQSVVQQRVNLVEWAKTKEVQDAWHRLAEREGLDKDALDKATWPFTSFVLSQPYNVVMSMSKARKAGFTGYIDSWESFENLFKDLEASKVLPKLH